MKIHASGSGNRIYIFFNFGRLKRRKYLSSDINTHSNNETETLGCEISINFLQIFPGVFPDTITSKYVLKLSWDTAVPTEEQKWIYVPCFSM